MVFPASHHTHLWNPYHFMALLEWIGIKQDSEDLAILTPVKPVAKRSARGKPVTKDDPLWNLVGIGHSGRGDVSANKHKYLAEAYLHHRK
jgi:hypothetical protein